MSPPLKTMPVTQHRHTAPAERQAVIFAVNDMHAAIDNFPKLAWIVDSLRTLYPDLLLIAAGDNQTGNPINDQFQKRDGR
jgi:5'-nucleotidase / UDP-sugar diphosphatase